MLGLVRSGLRTNFILKLKIPWNLNGQQARILNPYSIDCWAKMVFLNRSLQPSWFPWRKLDPNPSTRTSIVAKYHNNWDGLRKIEWSGSASKADTVRTTSNYTFYRRYKQVTFYLDYEWLQIIFFLKSSSIFSKNFFFYQQLHLDWVINTSRIENFAILHAIFHDAVCC